MFAAQLCSIMEYHGVSGPLEAIIGGINAVFNYTSWKKNELEPKQKLSDPLSAVSPGINRRPLVSLISVI